MSNVNDDYDSDTNEGESKYYLAIRGEGKYTIAAYCRNRQKPDHEGHLIGTMPRGVAELWPETFEAFKTCMSITIVHFVQAYEGKKVSQLIERKLG